MIPHGDAEALVVDWHAHWIPPELERLFTRRTVPPRLIEEEGRRIFLATEDLRLPVKEPQLDLELRRRAMAAAGIDRQVLSLAVLFGAGRDLMPSTLEDEIVAANNEGLARLVAAEPERFSGLAILPLDRPETAASVLEKAVVELGLLGAVVPAEAFPDKVAALAFRDVLATASRLGAHLFVHPGAFRRSEVNRDEAALIRRRAARFQDDQTAAAITFEYTDLLDPYPGAVIHLANLGGNMALVAERIAGTAERMGLPAGRRDGRLRRIVVDTASFGRHGLALAAVTLGADRIVLGSDHPALPLDQAVAAVAGAPFEDTERRAILTGKPFGPCHRF